MTRLNPISAQELKHRLDAGDAALVDIRETDGHAGWCDIAMLLKTTLRNRTGAPA